MVSCAGHVITVIMCADIEPSRPQPRDGRSRDSGDREGLIYNKEEAWQYYQKFIKVLQSYCI